MRKLLEVCCVISFLLELACVARSECCRRAVRQTVVDRRLLMCFGMSDDEGLLFAGDLIQQRAVFDGVMKQHASLQEQMLAGVLRSVHRLGSVFVWARCVSGAGHLIQAAESECWGSASECHLSPVCAVATCDPWPYGNLKLDRTSCSPAGYRPLHKPASDEQPYRT